VYITAEEFAWLLTEMRRRFASSGRDLSNPRVVRDLLRRHYPDIEGVTPAPGFAQIQRRYLPSEWNMELPQPPPRPRGPAISSLTPAEAARSTRPPPDPGARIISDLNLLRTCPIGALTYVTMTVSGVESREAMNWARLSSQLTQLLLMTPGGMRAGHRAISGQTGQVDAVHEARAVRAGRANAYQARIPTHPRGAPPPAAPPSSPKTRPVRQRFGGIPPEQTRARLPDIARRHGSGVDRR